jgi:diguanylate cyclase (GGDEF)-like protein/PAS domain S-box-containing protein
MKQRKKWSGLPMGIAMVGIGLLFLGWVLLLIFWHLTREKSHVDNRIRTGAQILSTLDSTDIAFQILPSSGSVHFFSPDILSGWAVQVHSEIESVLDLPFSWTPSDRISINRLDRAWASLFSIVRLSDTAHQEHLFGRIHEIILTRQSISRRASHSIKRLEKVSLGLSRTLLLIEAGIVSVGMSAFALFSLSVYFFRRTVTSLDRVSVAKSYLSAILEAVPTFLLLKDSKGGWLLVNKAALDVFGLDERAWENRTDREMARENPVYQEFFSACEKLDLEVMEKNEKTVSIETVRGKDGRSIKMEVTRIPLRNPDGTPMGIVVSGYDMTDRIREEQEILHLKSINEVLSDVDEFILGVPESSPLFEFVCNAITSRFPRSLSCWIAELDPEGVLRQKAFCGIFGENPEGDARKSLQDLETELSLEALETGKSQLWSDPPPDGYPLVRSGASVPFFRWGRVAGLMKLATLEEGLFSPEMLRLLESIARSLSFALDNLDREKSRKQSEEGRRQISSLYEALSRINRLTAEVPSPEVLFRETVRIAVETAGLALGWIGLIGEDKRLDFVVVEGRAKGYVEGLVISSDPDIPEGQGPGGQALRSGDPVIFSNFSSNPAFAPWLQKAESFDLSSSANFSFSRGGMVVGVMGLYYDRFHSFFPEQIDLFRQFASTLSFALDNWDRESLRKTNEADMELAASVALNTHEGVVIANSEMRVLAMNRAFTGMTGIPESEFIGKTLENLPLLENAKGFWQDILEKATVEGTWKGEVSIASESGSFLRNLLTINAVRNSDGLPTHYVAVFTDITRIKDEQARLEYLSFHDPLTGLPNRRAFSDRVEKALRMAKRSGNRVLVAILDLDGFKEVNDRFGHDTGDRFLVEVSNHMKAVLRENDVLARMGGDEFGLLIESIGISDGMDEIMDRFVQAMNFPFQVEEYAITLSGSIGTSVYPQDGEDSETLLSHADLALYQAKERGKNQWVSYEPSLQEDLDRSSRIREDLRVALETPGGLFLQYQPQANIRTGTVVGFEALLRWNHPERGVLCAEEFIDIVEGDAPLISALGRMVIQNVLFQLKKWEGLGWSDPVSVNVGALHFLDPGFLEEWNGLWRDFPGIPRSAVNIEISESAVLRDLSASRALIEALRDSGTGVILGGFGSGSSSLTGLSGLSVSKIAMDRSVTRTLLSDPYSIAIVSGVLSMAAMMKVPLLLGEVEYFEQGILFLASGGSLVQGHAVGLPQDPEILPSWMDSFSLPEDWSFWAELTWPSVEIELLRAALEQKRQFRMWMENPKGTRMCFDEIRESRCFWESFIAGEGRERFGSRSEFQEIQKISSHLHESLDGLSLIAPEKRASSPTKDLLSDQREMIRLLGKLVS